MGEPTGGHQEAGNVHSAWEKFASGKGEEISTYRDLIYDQELEDYAWWSGTQAKKGQKPPLSETLPAICLVSEIIPKFYSNTSQ